MNFEDRNVKYGGTISFKSNICIFHLMHPYLLPLGRMYTYMSKNAILPWGGMAFFKHYCRVDFISTKPWCRMQSSSPRQWG